jgi:hypothetical protein
VQKDALNQVKNHLRIFHSDCYKVLPQFVLRDDKNKYYNDRFIFLEQFLFMVRNDTGLHESSEVPHTQRVKWFVKKNAHIFDVPSSIALHPFLTVRTPQWEEVSSEDIYRNSFKIESYAMTYNIDHFVQHGMPMEELAVFNPANEYESFEERAKSNRTLLIPQKIHIIWIDGEEKMTPPKRKIMELNKALYPEYEYKVWSIHNVTREKFRTHDLIHNLYRLEETSRFSKKATMADVMRHEIMFNEGGWYLDSSMMLFSQVF